MRQCLPHNETHRTSFELPGWPKTAALPHAIRSAAIEIGPRILVVIFSPMRRMGARMSKSFQALYCSHFGSEASHFEADVFWKCVFRHAWLPARAIHRLCPSFFHEDFGFLRDLATAKCRGEVLTELNRFYGRNVRDRSFFRKRLLLRVSGKRILALYRQLLRTASVEEPRNNRGTQRDHGSPSPEQAVG